MMMSLRSLLLTSAAVLLSGCIGGAQQAIELESRSIAVEENAEPAGGPGGEAVSHLLPQAGPTYVTMTVTAVDKFNNTSTKNAITSGSGFIVDGSGTVMTAAHVAVDKGNLVSARAANGRIYSGKVIAIDPKSDMAVIKLRGYAGRTVHPASPGCISKGSTVFSLGKPHAQGDTARVGIFDKLHFGRPVEYGRFGYSDALVVRMSTRKGESGGPLFDSNGKLIGMVVSTLTDQAGNSVNQAHAVPSNALAGFLCGRTACSAEWQALANSSSDTCNGA
jgi:S1-C subfamily serine protease